MNITNVTIVSPFKNLGASFRKCFEGLSNLRKGGLRRASLRYGSFPRRTGGKGTKPFASLAHVLLMNILTLRNYHLYGYNNCPENS